MSKIAKTMTTTPIMLPITNPDTAAVKTQCPWLTTSKREVHNSAYINTFGIHFQ